MTEISSTNALSGVVSPGETVIKKREQVKGLANKVNWGFGCAAAFILYCVAGTVSSKINRDLQKAIRADNAGLAVFDKYSESEMPDHIKEYVQGMRNNNKERREIIDKYTSPIFAPFYVLD